MPFCEVAAGTKLYYEDFGEGPALVFTPSGSLTHKMWGSQVAALAGEYRTVAYDWRGTGASDKPRSGYTAENATEAARMVHEGVASAEDIDKAVKVGLGPRYSVMGPIEFIDYGGLDTAYYACHAVAAALDSPRHAPPPGLDRLMSQGKRGLREGQGYYDWRGVDVESYRRERFARFVRLFGDLGVLAKPGVA